MGSECGRAGRAGGDHRHPHLRVPQRPGVGDVEDLDGQMGLGDHRPRGDNPHHHSVGALGAVHDDGGRAVGLRRSCLPIGKSETESPCCHPDGSKRDDRLWRGSQQQPLTCSFAGKVIRRGGSTVQPHLALNGSHPCGSFSGPAPAGRLDQELIRAQPFGRQSDAKCRTGMW